MFGRETLDPACRRRRDRVHGVDVSSLVAGPPASATSDPCLDVVMVHGLAVSNRSLVPTLVRLGRDRRVFAPDLPGVRRSDQPSRRLSVGDLTDGVLDWMDLVGVGRAVFVGHSLGCRLVGELAARHPDRVAAVVLASPAPDPSQRPLVRQAWHLLLDGPREHPSMAMLAVADYLRVGPSWVLRAIGEARRGDGEAIVSSIQQPVLVVRGDRDPLVSPQWAHALVRALPSGELATIPGAPHGLPYSAPGAFAAAVRHFVSRRARPLPGS